ncbi:MAG: hypothetical protein HPY53_12270 [Brevinematales bacterium]|nr:hypothetical protein [Brevinematales bacterium]
MRKPLLILSLTFLYAILFSAPVKTPAPSAPLPKAAVLVSYDGQGDFYDFTASQDNYNLSAVYQSVMYLLPDYRSNFTFIEMDKMQFIPYASGEDKKAIESLGADYLIKINYRIIGDKMREIEFAGILKDGSKIVSNKLIVYTTFGPQTFEQIYSAVKNVMKRLITEESAKQAGQPEIGKDQASKFVVTYMTNYSLVTHTNIVNLSATNNIGKKKDVTSILTVYGPFRYINVINDDYFEIYSTSQVFHDTGYEVKLHQGMNILYFSMDKPIEKTWAWSFRNEKVFIINKNSSTNTTLHLKDFHYVPVNHIFLDFSFSSLGNSYDYLGLHRSVHFGLRIGIDPHAKLKFGIGIPFGSYIYNTSFPILIVGFEHSFSEDLNGNELYFQEYIKSLFCDVQFNADVFVFSAGINLRFLSLVSFSAGFEFGTYSTAVNPMNIGIFARYNIYLPYPTAYKNYELYY